MGRAEARVGIVEYSDFECPFCGVFARDTLPRITASYVDTGKVFFGFSHFPLESIHPNAYRAAELAECGRRQNRFWQVHHGLFRLPRPLQKFDVMAVASEAGLDLLDLKDCLSGDLASIRQSVSEARASGVRSTPTFVFGTPGRSGMLRVLRIESGALPFERFAVIVEEIIAMAGKAGTMKP